jgi:hypothetical protein
MDVPAAKRANWRNWAKQEIGGDDLTLDTATDAVLAALLQGSSVEEAMAAGRSAATKPRMFGQASSTTHPVSDRSHLRGQVASFRQRSELMGSRYGSVWDFRVDGWDAAGVPQQPVAVEMRGVKIKGSVGDGDWVEIEGRWKPGAVFVVRSLKNISQNARVGVDAYGERHPVRTLMKTLVTLLVVGGMGFIFYVLFKSL